MPIITRQTEARGPEGMGLQPPSSGIVGDKARVC